jgi:Spy/CpxP family protein refolding chaperone
MRRLPFIFCLGIFACSTYDVPQDRPPQRGGGDGGYRRTAARDFGPMLLDVVPDDTWWRDTYVAAPLNLTTDQFQALDKIAGDQRDEIDRIQRDIPIAARDLRTALDADPTSAADIAIAAQRLRDIRDSLFDRQAQMLSAERMVLTKQQWSKLLDALQQRRQQRFDRGDGGYPGGRGGGGGYPRGGRGRPW